MNSKRLILYSCENLIVTTTISNENRRENREIPRPPTRRLHTENRTPLAKNKTMKHDIYYLDWFGTHAMHKWAQTNGGTHSQTKGSPH